MSEEKKDACCSTGSSCGCCSGAKKLVVGMLLGVLIFATGMWFAKAKCMTGKGVCPMGSNSAEMAH